MHSSGLKIKSQHHKWQESLPGVFCIRIFLIIFTWNNFIPLRFLRKVWNHIVSALFFQYIMTLIIKNSNCSHNQIIYKLLALWTYGKFILHCFTWVNSVISHYPWKTFSKKPKSLQSKSSKSFEINGNWLYKGLEF